LKAKLEAEQPKQKVFRKKVIPFQNPWMINYIYAYRIHTATVDREGHVPYGKFILIQKIGYEVCSHSGDSVMRVQVFDRIFDEVPSAEETVETVKIIAYYHFPIHMISQIALSCTYKGFQTRKFLVSLFAYTALCI